MSHEVLSQDKTVLNYGKLQGDVWVERQQHKTKPKKKKKEAVKARMEGLSSLSLQLLIFGHLGAAENSFKQKPHILSPF